MRDFLERVAALRRERQSFATATVVGRRPPVSAHLGDRAIVYADGRIVGFVGGACSREIVRRQALDAIRTGRARLVSIRPDAAAGGAADPERVVVPMTCVSEGAVDVYVEPDAPPRRLVVVGATPVADALARTAATLDLDVVRVVDAAERRDVEEQPAAQGCAVVALDSLSSAVAAGGAGTAAVVASQGHYDEQALETILRTGAAYVGLVASRTRGAAVRTLLEDAGVPGVDAIRSPAGLDLGARTPAEVGLSILAEIVRGQADATRAEASVTERAAAAGPAGVAIDPVCGMEVEIATARHTADVAGRAYYFCCAPCRARFVNDPASFAARPA